MVIIIGFFPKHGQQHRLQAKWLERIWIEERQE